MKRYFFFFIFSFPVLAVHSQKRSEYLKDTIVWNSDYRLVKEDFKGKPAKGSFYGMTVSGIMLDSKQEVDGSLKFIVQAVFFRTSSWLKTDSAYGLNHEQKHFDICEIFARRLRQKIAMKHFSNSKKAMSEIKDLYKEIDAELKKEQDLYDDQTEHSIKTEKQELWNKKIASELEELKEFSATEVHVKMN